MHKADAAHALPPMHLVVPYEKLKLLPACGGRSVPMQFFKGWKTRTIIGSAMLGGIFGFAAAISSNIGSISLPELIASVVSAAAVCGTTASAFCRALDTCQRIRKSQNRPKDHTLCYRGNRMLPPDSLLTSNRKYPNHNNSDGLCYCGAQTPPQESNVESECDTQNRASENGLCYRGIPYRLTSSLSRA